MSKFIVRMRRVVITDVTVEGCTQEEAFRHPFDFAVDETDIEQYDYEVLDVRENT